MTRLVASHVRFIAVVAMLAGAVALTVYSRGSLGPSAVFSHLFYVPIALSAWWYGRRGILVALFLAALILTSHFLFRHQDTLRTDLLRAAIFLFIGALLAELHHHARRAQKKRVRLEGQIVRVREREQERIGQELHDEVCQRLSAIALIAESACDEELHPQAVRIAALLRETNAIARRIAGGLFPSLVRRQGLCAALEHLAETACASREAPICVAQVPNECPVADLGVAYQLYRIAQEALRNALRHAQPEHIWINLRRHRGRGLLEVCDDGRGIGPLGDERATMGIHIMEYRAGAIGGALQVGPRKEGGTRGVQPTVLKNRPQKNLDS